MFYDFLQEVNPLCIVADENSPFYLEAETVWSSYRVVNVRKLIEKMDIDEDDGQLHEHSNLADDEMIIRQPRLMAVLYTSGSTGLPKGVQITHQMAMNRICWQWNQFPFQSGDVGCLKTSLQFVDSVVELFCHISKPVSMVIARRGITSHVGEYLQVLERYCVTQVTVVATLMHGILSYLSSPPNAARYPLRQLRLWISNSEPLRPSLAEKFFEVFPDGCRALCNFYGSTETMADVTFDVFHDVGDVRRKTSEDGILSIGHPISNSVVYLVGDSSKIVPMGEIGEICVSGLNVNDKQGYVKEMNSAANFLQNPFTDLLRSSFVGLVVSEHLTLYKTGDYGRIIDGRIMYQGRRDQQVW